MNNKKQLWIVVPFMVMIYSVGMINFFSKDKTESSAENRTLQQEPSIENIINKDYATLYETYYTDQFIGRDKLLKVYTQLEIARNKAMIRGNYIIDNEWIMPNIVEEQDTKDIKAYADKLNEFSKSIDKENRDIYYVSTPGKSTALNHLYPKYVGENYGLKNVEKFSELLDDNYIKSIIIDKNFKENFTSEELESFYFKTDHHWNGSGAFEGFKYIMKNTNYLNEDEYNKTFSNENYIRYDETEKTFLGSYNRNLFSLFDKNEKIPYVYSKKSKPYEYFNYNGNEYAEMDSNLIIATEKELEETTYGGAYTYDIPLYKIINKDAPIKKKLLIVRDSFQAPTTLMFADLFESVEVLDPRNSMELIPSNVINNNNPDIVMFMFNSETFGNMIDLVN